MSEIVVWALLWTTTLLPLLHGCHALRRCARTSPELRLQKQYLQAAATIGVGAVLMLWLSPLAAATGVVEASFAEIFAFLLLMAMPGLLALSFALRGLAVPAEQRSSAENATQFAVWLIVFGCGACHVVLWTTIAP